MIELIALLISATLNLGAIGYLILAVNAFALLRSVSWVLIAVGTVLYAVRINKVTPIWHQFEASKRRHNYVSIFLKGLQLYAVNNWLAKDRAWYTEFGGDPNNTFSGAMGQAIRRGYTRPWCFICKILSKIDSRSDGLDHCTAAINSYAGRGSKNDRRVIR